MPKPSTLKFRVRRTRSGARLTFTAPSELDGAQQLFDYQIDMTDAELRKLYEEAAKAVADVGAANRRAKRVLSEKGTHGNQNGRKPVQGTEDGRAD